MALTALICSIIFTVTMFIIISVKASEGSDNEAVPYLCLMIIGCAIMSALVTRIVV